MLSGGYASVPVKLASWSTLTARTHSTAPSSRCRDWEGHPPDVLQAIRDHLAEMGRQGLATIND
jgi:hypothetical protein